MTPKRSNTTDLLMYTLMYDVESSVPAACKVADIGVEGVSAEATLAPAAGDCLIKMYAIELKPPRQSELPQSDTRYFHIFRRV